MSNACSRYSTDGYDVMREHPQGDWVEWDEYKLLQDEYDESERQKDELKNDLENLKDSIRELSRMA